MSPSVDSLAPFPEWVLLVKLEVSILLSLPSSLVDVERVPTKKRRSRVEDGNIVVIEVI